MKNITVLTVLVITLFLSINEISAEEQPEKDYGFSFGASIGFVYGQSVELVYPVNTPAKYLSELLWDMKPVFYLGLQADFGRINIMDKPGFFASLSFNIGLPSVTGIMEDRDWMNLNNDYITHYSRHTNKTREFLWLDLEAGMTIPVRHDLYIKPVLAGSWMRFAFTGRDGYGEYNFPGVPSYISYDGQEVIRYEQNWYIIAAGLSAGTKITFPLSFELSFLISPLIYCAAIDEHLTTHVTYYDYMVFGLFYEQKACASFTIKSVILSLEFSYRYIEGTKDYFNQQKNINKPGAGLFLFNSCFMIKYQF